MSPSGVSLIVPYICMWADSVLLEGEVMISLDVSRRCDPLGENGHVETGTPTPKIPPKLISFQIALKHPELVLPPLNAGSTGLVSPSLTGDAWKNFVF